MTINRRHLTRALMIAALAAGAWTASEAADTTAAHAGDKPRPAVEQSRGLLGLPRHAREVAEEVVDVPGPPAEPEQPTEPEPEPSEPAEEPTDEPPTSDRPRDEPTPAEPAPTTPAPSLPAPTLPNPGDVVDKVEDVVEQMPLPPMPEQPPADPVDKTDRDDDGGPVITLPLPLPLPLTPATEPVQVEVLTPTGPAPATQLPLAGVPLEPIPGDAAALEAAVCEDEPDPERDYERGQVRRILDRITGLHRAKPSRPLKPCPGDHGTPDVTNGAVPAVKPPGGYGADLIADGRGGILPPTPALLRHIWPRCHLPASRVTCVEPGPA